MRMHFDDLFQIHANGMTEPRVPVNMGGVTMGPGVSFGGPISMGEVVLNGRYLNVEVSNGVYSIIGYFPN